MNTIVERLIRNRNKRLNESIRLGDEVNWRGNKYIIIDDEGDQLTLRPSDLVDEDSFEGYGDSSEDIFLDRYQLKSNKMNENTDFSEYSKKVEQILKYQLGNYEESIDVEDISIITQTTENITFKVEYAVGISIPMQDSEDGRIYYERDTEYRTRTLTIDRKELE